MRQEIRRLKEIIDGGERIVLFTGAGFSVPSGIPDFRSAGGVYEERFKGYSAEYMLSHDCFENDTELFFDFYRSKILHPEAQPNAAHKFFAELERQGKLLSTVTQNIDGLHTAAGAVNVRELHGSVLRNYCSACGAPCAFEQVANASGVPHCEKCGGVIRPDVVLYGEMLDDATVSAAVREISRADVLIVSGTSLVVYPAALFVNYYRGDKFVLINKGATSRDKDADLVIYDDIERVVNELSAEE